MKENIEDFKKVYFAGKIGRNDWRHTLVPLRGESKEIILIKEKVIYTGPFFLSCDHGCFHGEHSHGKGIGKDVQCYGQEDERSNKKSDVFTICKNQILKSSHIFTYIDSDDIYGTIFEIGFAYSFGKNIFIAIKTDGTNKKFINDIWFMCQGANKVVYVTDEKEAFSDFLNYLKFECEKHNELTPGQILEVNKIIEALPLH